MGRGSILSWCASRYRCIAGRRCGGSALANDSQDELRRAVLDLDPGRTQVLEAAAIDQVCEAFADVVDAKSHFTFSHSMGVADAAVADCSSE